jgi:hypothetical protein
MSNSRDRGIEGKINNYFDFPDKIEPGEIVSMESGRTWNPPQRKVGYIRTAINMYNNFYLTRFEYK